MSGCSGLGASTKDGGADLIIAFVNGARRRINPKENDEDWDLKGISFHTPLSSHRPEESHHYAESHDQALVGDKTLIFRLIG